MQIDRHRLQLGAALGAQVGEEEGQRGLGAPGVGPDDAPRVVVDDTEQVAVALAVGHLVDADPAQAVEPVLALPERFVDDPLQNPADGGPVDPHELRHHGLWRVAHEERARVLEGAREARTRARPGNLLRDHAAVGAHDPAHLASQQAAGPKRVQVAPGPHRAVVGRPRGKAAVRAAHPPALWPLELHQDLLLGALEERHPNHPLAAQPEQPLE